MDFLLIQIKITLILNSIVIKLLRVARLQFLIVGLALFVFGALWAVLLGDDLSPVRLLFGYMVILPAQLSVHFSNDYFDLTSDRSGRGTLISGGGGVLLEHPELRKPAKWLAVILVFLSFGMGTAFIWIYSYPFWILGFVLLGNLLGWFYSAPPISLSQRGLGELCYTVISGFLIPGMGYLAVRGVLDLKVIYFTIPLALYGLVSILSVEIPDMEDDRLSGKRTWVAQKGRNFGFTLIGWLFVAATTYFFVFPIFNKHHIPLDLRVLGFFSLLPLGAGVFGLLKKPADREPATRVATWIVVLLAIFSIIVDIYLFYLTGNFKM
jgi:1,4-dihydroxy-2-naphthoate octaprenyltransferase